MTETTARFALPLLQAGQAQIDHNEALARIDAALHPLVVAAEAVTPPIAPTDGQAWLLGGAPAGAWSGQPHALAAWTASGWRFVAPTIGQSVWNAGVGRYLRWDGMAWRDGELAATLVRIGGVQVIGAQAAAIPDPAGGGVIDGQARSALIALLAAARAHGLIAP